MKIMQEEETRDDLVSGEPRVELLGVPRLASRGIQESREPKAIKLDECRDQRFHARPRCRTARGFCICEETIDLPVVFDEHGGVLAHTRRHRIPMLSGRALSLAGSKLHAARASCSTHLQNESIPAP